MVPLAFFKGCRGQEGPHSPGAGDNVGGSKNWTTDDEKTVIINNNNSVTNATKFTIGTSDESDEDDNAENSRDLERLFCPLTDSQGSPLFDPNDSEAAAAAGAGNADLSEMQPMPPFFGEQLSAVSCRRVHSEILESVSKIKCSLLGRKGGLLHSYGHYGSEAALNEVKEKSGNGGSGK